jgi:hypothetical protein
MLGIGGMALAVESSKPIPLFGSDDAAPSDLVIPDRNLLKGHVVVQKKGLTERIPKDDPVWKKYGSGGGYRPVARITRTQVPGGGRFSDLREHRLFVKGEFPQDVDPHVVYYKASHELREKFAKLSRERLREVPPELRAGATLVTVVEAPIMATSRFEWNAHHIDRQRGFDVVAFFRQGVRYSTEGLDTFNVYSEQGEYPIEVPTDIDMGILMKMDRQVLADGSLLIDDPRKWRPSGRSSRILRA